MQGEILEIIKSKVSKENFVILQEKFQNIPQTKLLKLKSINFKSPAKGVILGLFFGFLGVDRFYKGDLKLGILKLCFAIVCLVIFIYPYSIIVNDVLAYVKELQLYSMDEVIKYTLSIANNYKTEFFLMRLALWGNIALFIWIIFDLFFVYFGIKKDNFNKILAEIA